MANIPNCVTLTARRAKKPRTFNGRKRNDFRRGCLFGSTECPTGFVTCDPCSRAVFNFMKTQLTKLESDWKKDMRRQGRQDNGLPITRATVQKQKRTIRRTNAAKSLRICITVSAQLHGYLCGLQKLGLYGTSISDVAERLICESLHGDTKRLRAAALAEKQIEK